MKVEISIGELVDRVTILSIKKIKMSDPEKLKRVEKEYRLLSQQMISIGINEDTEKFKKLKEINLKLWQIEDDIRVKEAKKEFDDEFINLARGVYHHNDERSAIKREIDIQYHSELMEEKEYVDYKNPKENEDFTHPA